MSGIDWRRVYAGQAMSGLISVANWSGTMSNEAMRDIAEKSVKQAELLLEALQKPSKPPARLATGVSVDELGLTIRSQHCLSIGNIETIEELVTCNKAFLLSIPNLGKKSLREIIDALAARGLKLHD
jgi:DNA-directed RNA polymerase alpha subunit